VKNAGVVPQHGITDGPIVGIAEAGLRGPGKQFVEKFSTFFRGDADDVVGRRPDYQ
jgi:hypothetical protein